jgi:hypothetical protein
MYFAKDTHTSYESEQVLPVDLATRPMVSEDLEVIV